MDKHIANEAGLLQASIDGNSAAFESIVRKYQSLVCAITYSGTSNIEKSEELAQETFVRAWKNLKQLKDLASFKAWLCSIAKTTVKNHFRNQKRDIIHQAGSLDIASAVPSDAPDPADKLVSKEQQTVVDMALANIPELYRQPLILFYRQDQSTKQVAEQLDLTEETVRTRLSRGRKKLKQQVAAMVENTLSNTAPGKVFTTAVMASVAGLALKGAGIAAAATTAGSAATGTGITAVLSTVTAKIVTAAAVLAIGVGAAVAYKMMKNTDAPTPPVAQTSPAIQPQIIPDPWPTISATEEQIIAASQPIIVKKQSPTPAKEVIAKPTDQDDSTKTEEPAAVEFQPKGVLSGLISDIETGQPVVNARVNLEKGRYLRTTTDENGFYSFETINEEGSHRIGINSEDYVGVVDRDKQPQIYLKKDSKLVKHIQLPKACMVDTYVVDEEGNPIPDTRLWVTSLAEEDGRQVGSRQYSHSTDENGYNLLGGIPAASTQYLITAVHSKAGKWIEENNRKRREQIYEYGAGHSKVTLQDPNVIESCTIVLKKGNVVRGIAKYTDGTPAKECKIVPIPDWWHSLTVAPQYPIDPNGAFTLSCVTPGTYRIQASVPHGSGSSSSGITLFTTKLPLEKGKLLELTVPKKPTEVSSSGRVIKDSDPKPKLHGTVNDAVTGEPITDFRVRFKMLGASYYPSAERWTPFNDTKGEFIIDIVGGKHVSCKVQVVASGYASLWSDQINTANDTDVSIVLTRGGSVAGTVVDSQGAPVADAKVFPFSLAGSSRSLRPAIFASDEGSVSTDRNGRFTLKNLAVGDEYLKVIHPDYTFLMSPAIAVEQDRQNDIGNLVLENGGILVGFVYDDKGRPQPNVTLYAKNHYMYSSSSIQHATATSDPNGFYRMTKLPQELCYITQGKMYQKTGVVSRAIIPTNNKIARLDFGGGVIVKGRIVIDGKPLAQTSVNLMLGDYNTSGLFKCQANTDENGEFVLYAGVPATYTLSYNKMTKVATSQNFKLTDVVVGQKDIDLGVIPVIGKTLRINLEVRSETEENIRWFYLRENDPLYGECIHWIDQPALSDMPLQIDDLRPGLYYAGVRLDSGGEYRLAIEITKENDSFDVTFPIQIGHVTLSGDFPSGISHAILTNEDQTFNSYLFPKKETGKYSIDGLLPGRYFVSPKRHNFDNSIAITVPDVSECTYDFTLEEMLEKLTDDLFVFVLGADGYPVKDAAIWVECDGKIYRPAWHDGYSGRFYLPGGECIIHAEKDGQETQKAFKFFVDKNNTAGMESQETFIQFQQK